LEAGCDPVRVVVGARAEQVRQELRELDVEIVCNEAWVDGIAGSIRRGVEALVSRERVEAVVVIVCDQPALSSSVIRRLIDTWDGSSEGTVACRYAGTLGVPALFGRGCFPRLMRLEGDCGAKALLFDDDDTKIVDWPEGARDIDEPSDLDPDYSP